MVVTDIRVGDDNAREILRRTRMNHGFKAPIGFVNRMGLFGDSSKVFLVPHKFEHVHVTFIVKVNITMVPFNIYVHNLSTSLASSVTLFTLYINKADGLYVLLNAYREFGNAALLTTIHAGT